MPAMTILCMAASQSARVQAPPRHAGISAAIPGSGPMGSAETLRQGVAADADAIRGLTRAAYAKWVPVIGREPKPMTADYAAALTQHRFDLLHVDGKLAALIETVAQAEH